jgi:hypothetical protein
VAEGLRTKGTSFVSHWPDLRGKYFSNGFDFASSVQLLLLELLEAPISRSSLSGCSDCGSSVACFVAEAKSLAFVESLLV